MRIFQTAIRMTADARLGVHVHRRIEISGYGGKNDSSFFVVYPDPLYPRLPRNTLDDAVYILFSVQHHAVLCRPPDQVAQPEGALLDILHETRLLHMQDGIGQKDKDDRLHRGDQKEKSKSNCPGDPH